MTEGSPALAVPSNQVYPPLYTPSLERKLCRCLPHACNAEDVLGMITLLAKLGGDSKLLQYCYDVVRKVNFAC